MELLHVGINGFKSGCLATACRPTRVCFSGQICSQRSTNMTKYGSQARIDNTSKIYHIVVGRLTLDTVDFSKVMSKMLLNGFLHFQTHANLQFPKATLILNHKFGSVTTRDPTTATSRGATNNSKIYKHELSKFSFKRPYSLCWASQRLDLRAFCNQLSVRSS